MDIFDLLPSEGEKPITVADLDALVAQIAEKERYKDAVELQLKELNKAIMALETRATEILKSLGRKSYDSPWGSIGIDNIMQVVQPSDDRKEELWAWMREKGIFDRYASVNSNSLRALFKRERELAIENGEDPLTFALPGMVPATFFQKLKFRPSKG